MIERITTTKTNSDYETTHNSNIAQSGSAQKKDSYFSDTMNTGVSSTTAGVYTKSAGVKVDAATVSRLKEEFEKASENLRAYVTKLILNQGNAQSMTPNIDVINQAKQAISDDGDWGVKAVSDRIVDFAKAICGNDKLKMETIKAAIEKGFDEAGKAFGSKLPGVCGQTHDEIMKKLDEWVKEG
jgi:anti-sigma28 factor (negative regulator of flagellin synthesis)